MVLLFFFKYKIVGDNWQNPAGNENPGLVAEEISPTLLTNKKQGKMYKIPTTDIIIEHI